MSEQKKQKLSDKILGELDEVKSALKLVQEAREKEAKEKENRIAAGTYGIVGARSDSDEQKALVFFGVRHVKDLLHVNTNHPRFKHVPDHIKGLVMALKESVDISRWISQRFYGERKDSFGASDASDVIATVKGMTDHYYGKHALTGRIKAFGSTVAGEGADWVPTAISSQFIEEFELDRVLEGKFRSINMTTNPWELPVQEDVNTATIATEGSAMSSTNFKTDVLQFNATKFGQHTVLPEELNEDSAPNILALARSELVEAQRRASETAIVNGDDDGTHIDSDTQAGAADLAEKAWKGLRRQALANTANGGDLDFSGAAVTDANLRTMRTQMGKFGVNPRDLLWIPGPTSYQQMLATTDVVTVEKYGPQATVLTGALASYQGIPIAITEFMREDLNASGVHDGVTTDRTGVLLVHTKRWYVGNRRPIQTRVMQDLPDQDRWLLSSYRRVDFQGHEQDAGETSVVYGYNIQT